MNDAARRPDASDAVTGPADAHGAHAPLRVVDQPATTNQADVPEWLRAARGHARAIWAVVAPPDLVRVDRPSLGKVWRHAAYGEHLPAAGAARTAAHVYVVMVAIPVIATCYALAWTVERKSRAAVAAASIAVTVTALRLF